MCLIEDGMDLEHLVESHTVYFYRRNKTMVYLSTSISLQS